MPRVLQRCWSEIRHLWRPALTFLVMVAGTSRCIEWKQPMETEDSSIARYIAAVQTAQGDVHAVLHSGSPPAVGAGPVVSANIPALILLGGTIQVTVTSATPFNKVAIIVPGVTDYWELTLPGTTLSLQVLVVFSQEIPKHVFELRMAGAGGGAYGAIQVAPVSVITVGTGDVQVNITWDTRADVDLHVLDPSGAEIYWANKSAVTGGQLDLDSNAGCGSDGPRAENIFWPGGLIAPRGEYSVRVDYWSSCGAPSTSYVVTVNVRGLAPQVFSGVLIGQGDGGGKGSGRTIATVAY